ncbi:glycosyltransferase family 4 protein [Patescibacteria group bacterium]|nr:glycosyltransferase family 4 protein [Patescibacteria group bacterium]
MKICLYLEFYHFLNGIFYKNIGTGLLSSYKNQRKSLTSLGIEFTEKWDDACDILQINTPWLKSIYLIKKARRQGKKVIIWSHVTVEDFRQVFRFNKFLAPLFKKYLTYAYGLADLVFCPSQYTKSLLVAYGLPEEKLVVQSNGLDRSFYRQDNHQRKAARKQHHCQGIVIGTVGLVIPRKGVESFIQLARRFPQYQFIWFGKIYSQLVAKSLPKKLPANVRFTGYVDDINAAFNALDIFLFLSYEENQGMVILEAASVGLPMLIRQIPTYQGWLVHDQNCFLAKNDDELEKYLRQLLQDADLRKQLSAGAELLAQKEDITVLNKKLLAIYQKLLK